MVNFGKKLMADQIPEWKGYNLCFLIFLSIVNHINIDL
jgi:hypothetical protein